MSELGQNEGQSQDEKTPFFDSAKISEKKDVEHFSNVEGAAERAKAAERAQKAAEKEAAEVHAADVRAASEQMAQAEKEKSGKKGGILGFLFDGWHKVVTILVVLMLIGGGILGVYAALNSDNYELRVQKETAAEKEAQAKSRAARSVFELEPSPESYVEAERNFEESIKDSENEESAFIKIEYAEFVYENTKDFQRVTEILEGVRDVMRTEVGANFYNLRVMEIYNAAGMVDEFNAIEVDE